MILPVNVKKFILVNAGHFSTDPGASGLGYTERDEVKKIRDEIVPLLQLAGFEVFSIPDNLSLVDSIKLCDQKAPELADGFAIDIHLNSASNPAKRGAEAYHGTSLISKNIAKALSANTAKALSIPDAGAHPDTDSYAGSLGWIRLVNCWSGLIEVGYISNLSDMTAIAKTAGGYKMAALGITNGICEIFGVPKLDLGNATLIGRMDVAILDTEKHLADLKSIRKLL